MFKNVLDYSGDWMERDNGKSFYASNTSSILVAMN